MPLIVSSHPPPQTDPGEAHRGKLGRIFVRDNRDFAARALLEEIRRLEGEPILRGNAQTYLPPRYPLRQRRSSCVLHAVAHRRMAAPHPVARISWDPDGWAYDIAQAIDEWRGGERAPARKPGEGYYQGTSVRAGLELLRHGYPSQAIPRMPEVPPEVVIPKEIHSYWRLKTWGDVLDYSAAKVWSQGGSVAWGTNWSDTMFKVDTEGYLRYDRNRVVGGHATLEYHCNIARNRAGFQNSWGVDPYQSGMWFNGRFYVVLDGPGGHTLHDMYDDDADAFAVVETGTPLAAIAQRLIEQGHLT